MKYFLTLQHIPAAKVNYESRAAEPPLDDVSARSTVRERRPTTISPRDSFKTITQGVCSTAHRTIITRWGRQREFDAELMLEYGRTGMVSADYVQELNGVPRRAGNRGWSADTSRCVKSTMQTSSHRSGAGRDGKRALHLNRDTTSSN